MYFLLDTYMANSEFFSDNNSEIIGFEDRAFIIFGHSFSALHK